MSQTQKIAQNVLLRMRDIFRSATGSRRRGNWLRANGISGPDWLYSTSASDVMDKKIPSRVAGDFARAKLFCKIASDFGLECYVVCTANTDDLKSGATFINGFPLIAINVDGVLRAFNPAHWPLRFIPGRIMVGEYICSVKHWMPCEICAILPADAFMNISSYRQIHNIYTNRHV